MAIYRSGDKHRDFSSVIEFCKEHHTTKEDILIILGDAGINYYVSFRDDPLKQMLEDLPITLLCIHGNHEERPFAIPYYKEVDWHGGKVYVQEEFPSILFAKDGEIYDLDGKKAIAIGGAYSVDKYYRLRWGYAWFANEQPSDEIKAYVEEQLEKVSWKVDYVLSHTSPIKYEPTEAFLEGLDQSRIDKSTEEWLDSIEDRLEYYEKWFCGHYHIEKKIDKMEFMFENFAVL